MTETVAVLGASPKAERYSNKAIHLLRHYGHTVIPVNPIQREIAGLPVAASLAAITEKVDTVTVYVSPVHLEPLVDGLLDLVEVKLDAPVRVWRNLGAGTDATPAPMGHWLASSRAQATPAALNPTALGDLGGAPTFSDNAVEVELA